MEPKCNKEDQLAELEESQTEREAGMSEELKASAPGKENLAKKGEEKSCFECHRPLARSKHLINIAGQTNKSWHPECFKCNICNNQLDREPSCHVYKNKIICKQDYLKLQRDQLTKCSRCQWPISSSDWVRRANDYIYHLACFSCDYCLRQLSTGEQFTLSVPKGKGTSGGARLLCRLHFGVDCGEPKGAGPSTGVCPKQLAEQEAAGELCSSSSSPFELGFSFQPARAKAREQKFHPYHQEQYLRMLQQVEMVGEQLPLAGDLDELGQELMSQRPLGAGLEPGASTASSTNDSNSGNLIGLGPSKSKRVRTTFTEDQLSILQRYFSNDSNPDGQDLEKIATLTGLSKRVTQVWFQNSRARQKKYQIKKKPPASNFSVPVSGAAPASVPSGLMGGPFQGAIHKRVPENNYQLDNYQANSLAEHEALEQGEDDDEDDEQEQEDELDQIIMSEDDISEES